LKRKDKEVQNLEKQCKERQSMVEGKIQLISLKKQKIAELKRLVEQKKLRKDENLFEINIQAKQLERKSSR